MLRKIGQEEQSLVMDGFITSPSGLENNVFMSLGEDLAVYNILSGQYEILLEGAAPMNITPLEDGLLYSDEVSEYMYFYDYESGRSELLNGAPNYGVTIYEGKYYYVSNDGTAALISFRTVQAGKGAGTRRAFGLLGAVLYGRIHIFRHSCGRLYRPG